MARGPAEGRPAKSGEGDTLMSKAFGSAARSRLVAGLALAAILLTATAAAEAQAPGAGTKGPSALTEPQHKVRINSWTIGLAAGRLEGAPVTFASELARVVDDGDNMRVIPMVTRGPFDNVYDLLYLRGVDAAIVYGDVLDYFKARPEFATSWRRISYLLNLFPSEVHVFARPEIKSLKDLAGKVVNFNTPGTAANFSGPIIFKQLGIEVKATFIPHNVAMEKMKQGEEIAATFWLSTKPLPQFLKGKWPEGFRFLPVEYTEKLEYYAPAQLDHADYPALIPQGQHVATISVPTVLAVYDWPKDTERYQRVVRLVDYLFARFDKLQNEPGYHPRWKDVNLAGSVPGWPRFRPMQERLDRLVSAAQRASIRRKHERSSPARRPTIPRHRSACSRSFWSTWSGRRSRGASDMSAPSWRAREGDRCRGGR